MKKSVHDALRAAPKKHVYLITLEVDPLTVGRIYNPLPSHLTLISRFWSEREPAEIASVVEPIMRSTELAELIFGEAVIIGPKQTLVHLIKNSTELKSLHMQIIDALNSLKVEFTQPQFIGEGHKPHVSKRKGADFVAGQSQPVHTAYLIEVVIRAKEQLRYVRTKFVLGR